MARLISLLIGVALLFASGCNTRHEVAVEPMEVKPIHITIDVNIRVDKALDDFFDEIDDVGAESENPENAQ